MSEEYKKGYEAGFEAAKDKINEILRAIVAEIDNRSDKLTPETLQKINEW